MPRKKPREGHDEAIKRRIVSELAMFQTTGDVRKILKDEYGVDWTLQDIIRYDASKDYCVLGESLKALFHQTRKEYVEGIADVHVSSQTYRLRRLQAMSQKAEASGNFKLAAELLEQAAKDYGGIFTNVRQVNGDFKHRNMTPAEARETIAEFMAQQKADAKKGSTKH